MRRSYWSDGLRPRSESWRELRRLRASPPGAAAANDDRRLTFSAALEQAQQLAEAAEVQGTETRALSLFYALSQAGRAISAAAIEINDRADDGGRPPWKLAGHGIRFDNPRTAEASEFDHAKIQLGRGKSRVESFPRLADLLDSDDLALGCELSDLWEAVPETRFGDGIEGKGHPALWPTWLHGMTPPWCNASLDIIPASVMLSCGEDEAAIANFLSNYPTLKGAAAASLHQRPPYWTRNPDGSARLAIQIDSSNVRNVEQQTTTLYRGSRLVLPAQGGSGRVLHPILNWWALLFALAQLTRYEPRVWSDLCDVDSCSRATRIEFLLEIGLDAIPDLVLESLAAVTKEGENAQVEHSEP